MNTNRVVFFVVLVCVAAVILALVVGDRRYNMRTTYSEFLQQVQAGEVAKATIAVAETGANPVTYSLKNGAREQTIVPRDYKDALVAMQTKLVNVEIRSASWQSWSTLANASPFFILLGFWFFMMRQLKNKPKMML